MKKLKTKDYSKSIMRLFLLCWISFQSLSCNAQNNLSELANSLVQKERFDSIDLYSNFKKTGKEAIPYLINVVDRNVQGFVGFQDYNSSTLYPIHLNYVGIRAAYIIEYILANTNNKKIFNYGIIVKLIDDKPVMQPLTYEDMKALKALYQNWWEDNGSKSITELVGDWKNNKRALTNSCYKWE